MGLSLGICGLGRKVLQVLCQEEPQAVDLPAFQNEGLGTLLSFCCSYFWS